MALDLDISVTLAKDSTYFDITDVTGLYNSVTNIGGYGGIYPATTTVEEIVISITRPDISTSQLYTFAVSSGTITGLEITDEDGDVEAISGFSPTTFDEDFVFRVLAEDFGLEDFDDGSYVISMAISSTSPSYEYSVTARGDSFFINKGICCLDAKLVKYANGTCGCSDNSEILELDLNLKAAQASANCRDLTAAKRALKKAQKVCDGGCGC